MVIAACALVALTVTTTAAYLTDHADADNQIQLALNQIHIEENFDPPADPKPGTVIPKSPRVVNDSNIPVYVRMMARFSDSDAQALCKPIVIGADWTLKEDGYYYYGKSLAPGERTVSLFDQIVLRSDIKAEDLIPFDVLVYAESVQVNGLDADSAWAVFGGSSK